MDGCGEEKTPVLPLSSQSFTQRQSSHPGGWQETQEKKLRSDRHLGRWCRLVQDSNLVDAPTLETEEIRLLGAVKAGEHQCDLEGSCVTCTFPGT